MSFTVFADVIVKSLKASTRNVSPGIGSPNLHLKGAKKPASLGMRLPEKMYSRKPCISSVDMLPKDCRRAVTPARWATLKWHVNVVATGPESIVTVLEYCCKVAVRSAVEKLELKVARPAENMSVKQS